MNHKSLHTFKSVTIMFHPKYPDNTMRSLTPNIATIMPPTLPFPTKQIINHLRRHHPMHPKFKKMKKMMTQKMIRYFHVILILATPINQYYIPLYKLFYCQNSIQCCCPHKKKPFFGVGGGGFLVTSKLI